MESFYQNKYPESMDCLSFGGDRWSWLFVDASWKEEGSCRELCKEVIVGNLRRYFQLVDL